MNRFDLGPLWWFVIIGSAIALAIVATSSVRAGGMVLAAVFAAAGLGRFALPDKRAGALFIRSRLLDGTALLVLGGAILFLFSVVKLTPLPG